MLGICWLQRPFCFMFQMWGVQEPLERKRAECGVRRRGLAQGELLSLIS